MRRLHVYAISRSAVILGLAFLLTACTTNAPGSGSQSGRALKVVATTTVLADMVHQVGGPDVDVTSIVPKGGVVETFDPSPRDIAAVSGADVVVMNGLGLDDWLVRVIRAANPDVHAIRLAEDLPGVSYVAGEDGEGTNPHLW